MIVMEISELNGSDISYRTVKRADLDKAFQYLVDCYAPDGSPLQVSTDVNGASPMLIFHYRALARFYVR